MTVLIQIARDMAWVIVVRARFLDLPGFVAMPVRVQIARRVSRMVVMRAKLLFFCHVRLLRAPDAQDGTLRLAPGSSFRPSLSP